MTVNTELDEYNMMWKSHIENEDGSINWDNLKQVLAEHTSLKSDFAFLVQYATGELNDSETAMDEVTQTMDDLVSDILDSGISGELNNVLEAMDDDPEMTTEEIYELISMRKELYDE